MNNEYEDQQMIRKQFDWDESENKNNKLINENKIIKIIYMNPSQSN